MKKKESISVIERENEFIKNIFSLTVLQEKNSSDQINKILSFLQNSKNEPNYFIKFIDYYSLCRPHHPDLSKLFVKCMFICFPETTEQNKTLIKNQTRALKYILFPEELQQKPSTGSSKKNEEFEKKKNELFSLIQKDDDTSLDSFIQNNQEFDIQKPQIIEEDNKYFPTIKWFKCS